MGHTARRRNVFAVLDALGEVLGGAPGSAPVR